MTFVEEAAISCEDDNPEVVLFEEGFGVLDELRK
jgi:hypothetical protein